MTRLEAIYLIESKYSKLDEGEICDKLAPNSTCEQCPLFSGNHNTLCIVDGDESIPEYAIRHVRAIDKIRLWKEIANG